MAGAADSQILHTQRGCGTVSLVSILSAHAADPHTVHLCCHGPWKAGGLSAARMAEAAVHSHICTAGAGADQRHPSAGIPVPGRADVGSGVQLWYWLLCGGRVGGALCRCGVGDNPL